MIKKKEYKLFGLDNYLLVKYLFEVWNIILLMKRKDGNYLVN